MPIEAHVERDGGNLHEVRGTPIFDVTGRRIGVIRDVYLNDTTERAEWVGIRTNPFGMRMRLVPLQDAEKMYPGIQVPYDRGAILHAPSPTRDGHLTPQLIDHLQQHYHLNGQSDAG